MLSSLSSHSQQIVFVAICILGVRFAVGLAGPCFATGWRRKMAWAVALVSVVAGCLVIDWAGQRERRRMQAMVEGFAPTYAQEMERLGHASINEGTAPDDPKYLEMVEAEKRWLRVNPSVNDIYTFRRRANGERILVVDSETDYDHNGRFEGEREQRTPIGEVYQVRLPELDTAFAGVPAFQKDTYSDRWGTWVSAFYPMHDSSGRVEAVLGIDFAAATWEQGISRARWTAVLYLCVMVGLLAALSAMEGLRTVERRAAESVRGAKERFENLVNSIECIVWEWDPVADRCLFVSPQAATLGYPLEMWTEETAKFRDSILHPDDRERVLQRHFEDSNEGEPIELEFRVITADGRTVWLREKARACTGPAGSRLLRGILTDVTQEKQAAKDLERLHQRVLETSRQAGMAEVATGMLHNVGNVLNSVNVSSTLIQERLANSELPAMSRIADLIGENMDRPGEFFAQDPRGRAVPGFLRQLADHLAAEHEEIRREAAGLRASVEHIRDIVAMQQSYAGVSRAIEPLVVADVLEDAVRLNAASFERHAVRVERDWQPVPPVLADRHRMLQILVNLLRNACDSLGGVPRDARLVRLVVCQAGGRVRISVTDSGGGIAPEHLGQVFTYGFTTKADGHGFGLHSAALAVQEMDGSLDAHSDGPGSGATFTLELPAAPEPVTGDPTPPAAQSDHRS